ncbi:exonuclease domain-containing protein [Buchnera aphidicola (Mollitrichosiphum nigrofasciatum)]|uniref:exonuclease domain-containing protein n=1 Tax=Buchnera aphidicola TaxID=9 RepID=UPI0031B85869
MYKERFNINKNSLNSIKNRFRKLLPIVIDIETTGLNPNIHAILEIAIITLKMSKLGWLKKDFILHFHIKPFKNCKINKKSLFLNKLDPFNPLRFAISEQEALKSIFQITKKKIKKNECKKGVIIAHNGYFDHSFLMKAIKRNNMSKKIFHNFTIFDTATLSALVLGQTVLSKSCKAMGISFNHSKAHSALYDAIKTAELFCKIINFFKKVN